MTLVSVIVPTYDRPDFLRTAVGSVAAQTHRPIELIVVDDQAPEPVRTVPGDVADAFTNTQVIRHATNQGAAAARNTGLEAADGEIVAFLDDDDRWTPEVAKRYVAAFRDAPESVGLVTVGARNVDAEGRTIGTVEPRLQGDALRSVAKGARIGSFSRFAVTPEAVRAAGTIDEELPVWQDLEWHCRLAAHCEFRAIAERLVERRIGGHEQLTDRYVARRDAAYPRIRDRHRPVMAERSRWLARQFMGRLARGLGFSALTSERYGEASCWFARAVRSDPTGWRSYGYLVLTLAGPAMFPAVRRCYRELQRVTNTW